MAVLKLSILYKLYLYVKINRSLLSIAPFLSSLVLIITGACQNDNTSIQKAPLNGYWRGELTLSDTAERMLPFQFVVEGAIGEQQMTIQNGREAIVLNPFYESNDSIEVVWPVFESGFVFQSSDSTMSGYWYDRSRGDDYKIPFEANYGLQYRFKQSDRPKERVAGTWRTHFGNKEPNALGLFKEEGGLLAGSFATETGDYRFLEGIIQNNQFKLSTLDGAHAFLFEGTVAGDSLWGTFYSGDHYSEPFYAVRDSEFELMKADELTFLKEGYTTVDFAFPDLNGDTVRLIDDRFNNKAIVIQLFGSWCPNCMDESIYLSELYEKEASKGLEIVGLGFERHKEFEKASNAIVKMRQDLLIPYTLLVAGTANKKAAAEKLPMLNHILSFPTAIVLNRKHKVVGIHTGFYGPGTGAYYDQFKEEFENWIALALRE